MDRRWALAGVWALFATASVGVGFAAAGLVGDPFSDPAGVAAAAPPSTAGSRPTSGPATPRPSGPSVSSPRPAGTGDTGPEPTVHSVTTRGGFVAGSCRAGLVTVSASPAIGWQIEDVDGGQVTDARVRFETTHGDGRVEVHSWCAGGTARFSVDDRTGGDDGSDGSGGSSGRGGGDG